MHHPELGRRILDQVVAAVEHLGKVEIFPRQDGRNMTMVLGPDRKAQAAAERAKRQAQAEASRGDADAPASSAPPASADSGAAAPPAADTTTGSSDDQTPVRAASTAEAGQPAPQDTPSDG